MAKENGAKVVSVKMKRAKICKSCVKYETIDDNESKNIGTCFYLQNSSFENLGKPDEITVTVS